MAKKTEPQPTSYLIGMFLCGKCTHKMILSKLWQKHQRMAKDRNPSLWITYFTIDDGQKIDPFNHYLYSSSFRHLTP